MQEVIQKPCLWNEKPVTSQKQEEFLQLVDRKLQQVEHMVKQLFDLAKMESAEFVPNKEPFIFSEIVLEIIHASSSDAGKKILVLVAQDARIPRGFCRHRHDGTGSTKFINQCY